MKRRTTTKDRVLRSIRARKSSVVLKRDVTSLGNPSAVNRALDRLIEEGCLTRLADGVYARVRTSSLTGGLILERPLIDLAKEFAKKSGATIKLTQAEKDYLDGSTQVPMGNVVAVDRRISKVLSYCGGEVSFEHVS